MARSSLPTVGQVDHNASIDPSDPAHAALDPLAAFRLDGRVALVTGASSGLGERFARVLHAAGAQVIVVARRADRLASLAAELDRVVPLPADLSSGSERERMAAEALAAFGRLDILVNNAGITEVVGIEAESEDTWERAVAINLTAPWHLSKLFAAALKQSGHGSVVNVASMLGLVAGTPVKSAHYAATKGGVVNMTRELAVQWARKGVRVNALCPGWFPSEMTVDMASEASQAFVGANCPMQRMGRNDELDGALLFLAGDASSYMTGQTLVIDGGWTAR
jgi:NAD(P)-dependent dehydrogenase (short-subunit alcohol dehydrogenase family)